MFEITNFFAKKKRRSEENINNCYYNWKRSKVGGDIVMAE